MCHFLRVHFWLKSKFFGSILWLEIKFLGQDFSLEQIFGSDCHETLNSNQLNMKYDSTLLVFNICHTEIIICIRKFTIVNILGGIPCQEI